MLSISTHRMVWSVHCGWKCGSVFRQVFRLCHFNVHRENDPNCSRKFQGLRKLATIMLVVFEEKGGLVLVRGTLLEGHYIGAYGDRSKFKPSLQSVWPYDWDRLVALLGAIRAPYSLRKREVVQLHTVWAASSWCAHALEQHPIFISITALVQQNLVGIQTLAIIQYGKLNLSSCLPFLPRSV